MIILGLDPSIEATGWGLIEKTDDEELEIEPWGNFRIISEGERYVDSGVFATNPKESFSRRLLSLYQSIRDFVNKRSLRVNAVAIERPFCGKNLSTALKLGEVLGVCKAATKFDDGLLDGEYAPKMIKKIVTGSGNATKEQVCKAVKEQLGITEELTLDESDALAVALTHARRMEEEDD